MRKALVGAFVLVVLAGCSSGPAGDSGGATTAASLGTKLGCTIESLSESGPNQLFTREDVSCAFGGEDVNIVTFGSASAKASYLEAAGEFGGIYVEGSDWVVGVEQQGTAEVVKSRLGGTIR